MKAVQVVSDHYVKKFLDFPAALFADDKNYIRPLDKDIEAVFDPKKINFSASVNVKDFYSTTKKMKPLVRLQFLLIKNTDNHSQQAE